jgi:hypothetical protein
MGGTRSQPHRRGRCMCTDKITTTARSAAAHREFWCPSARTQLSAHRESHVAALTNQQHQRPHPPSTGNCQGKHTPSTHSTDHTSHRRLCPIAKQPNGDVTCARRCPRDGCPATGGHRRTALAMRRTVERWKGLALSSGRVLGEQASRPASARCPPAASFSKVLPTAGPLTCRSRAPGPWLVASRPCRWKVHGHAVAGRLPAELIGAGQHVSGQVGEDDPAGCQPAGVPA